MLLCRLIRFIIAKNDRVLKQSISLYRTSKSFIIAKNYRVLKLLHFVHLYKVSFIIAKNDRVLKPQQRSYAPL